MVKWAAEQPLAGRRVLVTNASLRTSYAAVRSLQLAGATVFAADAYRVGMSQWSRHRNTPSLVYPSMYADPRGFIAQINSFVGDHRIDLIFPSHNETEVIARQRDHFPPGVCDLIPDAAVSALFNNKARAFELAERLGVPVPRRFAYESLDQLRAQLADSRALGFVVKLLTGNSSKGVFHVAEVGAALETVAGLIERFALPPERFPQVEEQVTGNGWGCSALYWRGERILDFCHKRLREKISTGGTSTTRIALPNPALQDYAQRILSEVDWHGLAMVEFKVNPETGEVWFIEVNPRMWGSIPFAIAAGADFPYLAALCAFEGPEAAREAAEGMFVREGFTGRWLVGDALVALGLLKRLRLRQAFAVLFGKRFDSSDDFFLNDLPAFAGEVGWYLHRVIKHRSVNPAEEGMVG